MRPQRCHTALSPADPPPAPDAALPPPPSPTPPPDHCHCSLLSLVVPTALPPWPLWGESRSLAEGGGEGDGPPGWGGSCAGSDGGRMEAGSAPSEDSPLKHGELGARGQPCPVREAGGEATAAPPAGAGTWPRGQTLDGSGVSQHPPCMNTLPETWGQASPFPTAGGHRRGHASGLLIPAK